MRAGTKQTEPLAYMFADDGAIPNNPHLPLLHFREALELPDANAEAAIEALFKSNGWGGTWRNGIFPYVHYHSMIHEGMGVARGRAKVRFGGDKGQEIDLTKGDVVVLPAGTGHQCLWASPDLMVIGTYPPAGRYDLCRGSKAEYAKAIVSIPQVPLPKSDPVYGSKGPLLELWRK